MERLPQKSLSHGTKLLPIRSQEISFALSMCMFALFKWEVFSCVYYRVVV